MIALLVTFTLLEIVIFVGVLVYYLNRIIGSLRRTSGVLGKVSFGVRAIETQCSAIGPSVLTINDQLRVIAGALRDLAGLANARVDGAATTAGRR